ncbi:hypothetical protein [Lysobacter sp. F6437]|uniref:hypothetical protein n=1 Tax=Lysobacter sp. F6437 TaxID=3459296 RepID=UPI00403DB08D
MRLILHAGAHKTGTTLIQRVLAEMAPALLARGIQYVDYNVMKASGWYAYLHPARKDPALGLQVVEFFRDLIDGSRAETLLLSAESVFSFAHLWGVNAPRHFYGDMEHSAQRFRDLGLFEDIRIVYYVRRQDSFVNSVYLEYVKGGGIAVPFEEFYRKLEIETLSWKRRLDLLADVFGHEKLSVGLFEDIRQGARHYVLDFLSRAGIEGVDVPALDMEGSNRSLSVVAYEKAMAAFPDLEVAERRKLGRKLQKEYSNRDHPPANFMTDERRLEILVPHIGDNHEMFRRFLPARDPHAYDPPGRPVNRGNPQDRASGNQTA